MIKSLLPAAVLGVATLAFLAPSGSKEAVLSTYRTSLDGRTYAQRHNALLAVEKLRHVVVGPGEIFSFNGEVGSWSRDQGYRRAPVSYNGTLVADWGGGVCQASTTLYNAALLAGMKILERSPHQFSPSYVPPGRDAAVAFGDIDLRFQNPLDEPVTVEGKIERDDVVFSIVAAKPLPVKPEVVGSIKEIRQPQVFSLPGDGGTHFIRNSGKPGCEVWTYRVTGAKRELVSVDSYPVMNVIREKE
jgi:vancomycin resistance protein YoaR